MSKILITLSNPPANMNESQLFDDKAHLIQWMAENEVLLSESGITIDADNTTINNGTIEAKADNFKNYEEPKEETKEK